MGVAETDRARPGNIDAAESALRQQLAACYQLFDFLGWSESIFNHISLRVPGPERHFLMNPFGLNYDEVTAANLVKVDLAGENVQAGPYRGNPAGFAIHGAIHEARADAHCVIHTHTTAGMAVACKAAGLSHDNFYGAMLHGRVAYHEFEGITVRPDERPRIVASLGDKEVLILRNHGLLVLGADLPSAFLLYWTLQRACEVQAAGGAIGGPDRVLSDAVRSQMGRDARVFDADRRLAQLVFDAMVRRMRAA
ncbi:MAG TPA: class II aldolase/adducin family protein [Burkholderiaceae bacterium]|nr:class II aldolase/adducin family protein [Burkholderiaceae bacterium]